MTTKVQKQSIYALRPTISEGFYPCFVVLTHLDDSDYYYKYGIRVRESGNTFSDEQFIEYYSSTNSTNRLREISKFAKDEKIKPTLKEFLALNTALVRENLHFNRKTLELKKIDDAIK